jgi:hypothetical protein
MDDATKAVREEAAGRQALVLQSARPGVFEAPCRFVTQNSEHAHDRCLTVLDD